MKFENLKLMLHFKAEFMETHKALDDIVSTFEQNGTPMQIIKQSQHAIQMRVKDEINQLNQALQMHMSKKTDNPVIVSEIFDMNS